uniref:Ddb1 and cul4 associated factor 11 n=1 Tax=Neolamprologus brichardi TaxID=32507 RepID=A0A3Q4I4M2_NEOBR
MGSQSSSGMSGGRGSSSGNPGEQSEATESNQGGSSSRGRRTDRQSSSEEDVDLAEVLAYLLRRGQVRLVHGSGATGLQLVQSYSDSDEDSDGAWDGRLGDRYNPPVDTQPDTHEVDRSEIRTQILLATASSSLKGYRSFTRMLAEREKGRCRGSSFSHGECSRIRTHFLPNYVSHKDTYQQKAFCGVYSEDGNMFLSACQDQNIRLYDTSRGRFHLWRTVKARDVGWSVLDVCFTPDAHHVLYSSWSDYMSNLCVCVCAVVLCSPDERRFCVFSLAASTDGKEILGGANDGCLYVFDLEQNKRMLKVSVSLCAFMSFCSRAALAVPVSASRLSYLRFILRSRLGDARYLISNSKDQSIKLWDVRKFSPKEGLAASRLAVTQQNWDYRWQQVPQRALKRHKLTGDTSVMTYRGHGVLHTLIRCRFSPEFSTGQRFIYSGCSTGKIVIYDVLTGTVVTRLVGHDACVRDVSWHPYEDNIISSSWDGAVRMWEHRQTHPLDEERDTARGGGGEEGSCWRK